MDHFYIESEFQTSAASVLLVYSSDGIRSTGAILKLNTLLAPPREFDENRNLRSLGGDKSLVQREVWF